MKCRKRPFQKGILQHCYQPSADGGLLFYSYSDYLVWFSMVCIEARKHDITLLAVCPMPDHIHLSLTAPSAMQMAAFMRDINSEYARHYHTVSKTEGPVFQSPFGSAPKYGAKKGRTNIIYVLNNPVERQLASKAVIYRWNFLAYAVSDHPFSSQLVVRKARRAMQNALKEVKEQFQRRQHLNYAQLKRLFAPLTPDESQQLTDFIIVTYNAIDYAAAIKFFDSYEDLLKALDATTGSEYDLNEVFIGKSDAHYKTMASVIMRELRPDDIHDILSLDLEHKVALFQLLRQHTDALADQIAKFLHMPMKKGPVQAF